MTTFADREDGAAQLARALAAWRGKHPVVLGIPRGAVPMAAAIADALQGELDVVLVHKIGAPGNPEFAIGAVDETGEVSLTEDAGIADSAYIREEAARQLKTLRERRARYTPWRAPVPPKDRVVIVVDDGLATGATMNAALKAVRAQAPKRLICAVPVGSREAVAAARALADDVVCLYVPDWFGGVSRWYARFGQVEDEQVIALLKARSADEAP